MLYSNPKRSLWLVGVSKVAELHNARFCWLQPDRITVQFDMKISVLGQVQSKVWTVRTLIQMLHLGLSCGSPVQP